jgi:DNA-binding MarR family transcriptional regulator
MKENKMEYIDFPREYLYLIMELRSKEWHLFSYLMMCLRHNDEIEIKYQRIRDKIDVGLGTITAVKNKLVEKGIIEVITPTVDEKKRGRSTIWRIKNMRGTND